MVQGQGQVIPFAFLIPLFCLFPYQTRKLEFVHFPASKIQVIVGFFNYLLCGAVYYVTDNIIFVFDCMPGGGTHPQKAYPRQDSTRDPYHYWHKSQETHTRGGGSSSIFVYMYRCAIPDFQSPPFNKVHQRQKFDHLALQNTTNSGTQL